VVLREFDVPYFHMREFGSSKKAFAGDKWRDEYLRRYFVSALVATIKKWALLAVGSYMITRFIETPTNCAKSIRRSILLRNAGGIVSSR
jgi:hypothetical protein